PAARELVVVDDGRARHVEDAPAGVAQAALEVEVLAVDEEVRIEVAHLARRRPANQDRRRLDPADLAHWPGAALGHEPAVQEERLGEDRAQARQAPGRRALAPAGLEQPRAGRGGAR